MQCLLRRARVWLAGAVVVLIGACSETPESTAPRPADDAGLGPIPYQASPDDPVALARWVRGFGGFFLDRDGVPTVYLTDPAEHAAAAAALAPYLAAQGLDRSRLRTLRADFDYARLERWFEEGSSEALSVPGAVFVDLDEASNRLRVGVAHGASEGEVRRALAALRVPAEAVVVEQTAPIRQLVGLQGTYGLQSRVRPVPGGVMTDFILGLCTIGFNAVRSGQLSFITASHCTWTQGGVEGSMYWQHTWLDFSGNINDIGTEVADPVYFSGGRRGRNGCPRNRVCRYSDSSRGAYILPASDVALGRIAKPTGSANGGSLTFSETFEITAEHTSDKVPVGTTVNKVGMTTGWTSADVTSTCVNVNIDGTNITQLCQTLAGNEGGPVIVGPGDSGSPVFMLNGTATLAGILWGGTVDGGLLAFSPLANVERELGDLTVIGAP